VLVVVHEHNEIGIHPPATCLSPHVRPKLAEHPLKRLEVCLDRLRLDQRELVLFVPHHAIHVHDRLDEVVHREPHHQVLHVHGQPHPVVPSRHGLVLRHPKQAHCGHDRDPVPTDQRRHPVLALHPIHVALVPSHGVQCGLEGRRRRCGLLVSSLSSSF